MYNSSKVIDGYGLTSGVDNSFTTNWIDVRNYSMFSFSIVFTGGSPAGTLTLQGSNDRQFTGGYTVLPLYAAGAENSAGAIKSIDDSFDVSDSDPFEGWGKNTDTVASEGVYILDQKFTTFGWARVVYTSSGDTDTQLDIFLTVKNDH